MDDLVDCSGEHHTPLNYGLDDRLCERAASIFRALGDPNRLRLLCFLAKKEMCVSELTALLRDNVPAVSQRLKLLKSERLVKPRRQGKHMYYRLADEHISRLIENGLAHGGEPDE